MKRAGKMDRESVLGTKTSSKLPAISRAGAPRPALTCRPADRLEIHSALQMILGHQGRFATNEQVIDFLRLSISRKMSVNDIWIAAYDSRMAWAVMPVLNPGRTLLLLAPRIPRRTEDTTAAQSLIAKVRAEHPSANSAQMIQVLIDSDDQHSQSAWEEIGFETMAELIYLNAAVRDVPDEKPLPNDLHWLTYSEKTAELFMRTVATSYEKSLDCPQLTGRRDIQDVIASHKASGEFNPDTWFLLARGNQPLGVALLSRTHGDDSMELVYLGLVPEARGQGIGDLLLRRSLRVARDAHCDRLVLAVDGQNLPALRLYRRHGMWQVTTRLAMIYLLPTGPTDAASMI